MDLTVVLAILSAIGGISGLTAVLMAYPLFKQARLTNTKLELEIEKLREEVRVIKPATSRDLEQILRESAAEPPMGYRVIRLSMQHSEPVSDGVRTASLTSEWFSSETVKSILATRISSLINRLPEAMNRTLAEAGVHWEDKELEAAFERLVEILSTEDELLHSIVGGTLNRVLEEAEILENELLDRDEPPDDAE